MDTVVGPVAEAPQGRLERALRARQGGVPLLVDVSRKIVHLVHDVRGEVDYAIRDLALPVTAGLGAREVPLCHMTRQTKPIR